METRLKQRLVGAVVLVALAVIFVPMILTGPEDDESLVEQGRIPPKPEAPMVTEMPEPLSEPFPGPTSPERVVVTKGAPETKEPAPAESPAAVSESATDVQEPLPEEEPTEGLSGWVVQVGSFTQEENALRLRDRLREKDYAAFVERIRGGDGKIVYRVRVGPEVERSRAEAVRRKLADTEGLSGLVTHHP
jgi:DedD protein